MLNGLEEDSVLLTSVLNFFSVTCSVEKGIYIPYLNDVLNIATRCAVKDLEIHLEDKEVF